MDTLHWSNLDKNNFSVFIRDLSKNLTNVKHLIEDSFKEESKPTKNFHKQRNKKVVKKIKVLYEPLIKKGATFFSTNRRGAEIIKYASNAFLATKISYMNEIGNLCDKSNVDVEEIALGNKWIGKREIISSIKFYGKCDYSNYLWKLIK